MSNINIYGTLHNVTGEAIVESSQVLYKNTSLEDILDNLYVKVYDFTKDASYSDVSVSSSVYDGDTNTTKMNGVISISVPTTQTYNVEIQTYLPNAVCVVNSKYFILKENTTLSFENSNKIEFQFMGDVYVKKIIVRSGNKIPNKLSDLTNDVYAKTIFVEEDNECITINNI